MAAPEAALGPLMRAERMTLRFGGLAPHAIAKLGVGRTFQGLQLFPGLTVVDNLLTGWYRNCAANAGFVRSPMYRSRCRRTAVVSGASRSRARTSESTGMRDAG